jgi:hypothetical protein
MSKARTRGRIERVRATVTTLGLRWLGDYPHTSSSLYRRAVVVVSSAFIYHDRTTEMLEN